MKPKLLSKAEWTLLYPNANNESKDINIGGIRSKFSVSNWTWLLKHLKVQKNMLRKKGQLVVQSSLG